MTFERCIVGEDTAAREDAKYEYKLKQTIKKKKYHKCTSSVTQGSHRSHYLINSVDYT